MWGVGSIIVIKALCYKLEGCGFETGWGEGIFLIFPILRVALGPGVYSASDRNEYQKKKNIVFESTAQLMHKADNLTAICEPTVQTMWDP
jgi:hypothetical protein